MTEAKVADATPDAAVAPTPPTPPRRSPGHRGQDVRDTVAEMAAKAHEISLEAGSKMSGAMKNLIHAAAGITGFAVESARDIVQYMVRRGQMTQDEADRLLRDVEEAQGARPPAAKHVTESAAAAPAARTPTASAASPKSPAATTPAATAPKAASAPKPVAPVPPAKKKAEKAAPARKAATKAPAKTAAAHGAVKTSAAKPGAAGKASARSAAGKAGAKSAAGKKARR